MFGYFHIAWLKVMGPFTALPKTDPFSFGGFFKNKINLTRWERAARGGGRKEEEEKMGRKRGS